jgi:hypothetical protein
VAVYNLVGADGCKTARTTQGEPTTVWIKQPFANKQWIKQFNPNFGISKEMK